MIGDKRGGWTKPTAPPAPASMRLAMRLDSDCANRRCLDGANCPGHPWHEDELGELDKIEASSRDMNVAAYRGAGFRQAANFYRPRGAEAERTIARKALAWAVGWIERVGEVPVSEEPEALAAWDEAKNVLARLQAEEEGTND